MYNNIDCNITIWSKLGIGEGNGTPLQYSCLENPMIFHEEPGRLQSMGSLRVGHYWVTSLSLSRIGEGNGSPLQCSCLENPRDRGAWWAAVSGVAQSRTRLKRLSSSSSATEQNWRRKHDLLLDVFIISKLYNLFSGMNKRNEKSQNIYYIRLRTFWISD